MRCRKVRSCLSAYCKDELSGSRKLAVSEHLSTCSDCRREESEYRSMLEALGQVPAFGVSDDFNNKLFNRIAEERFAETRSKAYLPTRAPLLGWTRLVPAVAAACLLLVVGVMFLAGSPESPSPMMASGPDSGTDEYLTAQPVNNPNMTASLEKDWTLNTQIARAERLSRISRSVGTQVEFVGVDASALGLSNVSSRSGAPAPYVPDFFRVRPVVKTYHAPQGTTVREVSDTY